MVDLKEIKCVSGVERKMIMFIIDNHLDYHDYNVIYSSLVDHYDYQ